MPTLRAEELLRDHSHELTAEGLRSAVFAATGSEDEAEIAYCRRLLEESRPK